VGAANVASSSHARQRFDNFRRDPGLARAWLDTNIILQVNASSLLDNAPARRARPRSRLSQSWVAAVAAIPNVVAQRPRMTKRWFIDREFGVERRTALFDQPGKVAGRE
jgi:hypothetical protein